NISAIVGDLYPEGGERRDAGFSIFYMGINSGAFLGQLVTGFLGEQVGWHWGFGAAGVGMIIGLSYFAARAKSTRGMLGLEPDRHPGPGDQARQTRTAQAFLTAGLAASAVVAILAAACFVALDAQVLGRYMTVAMLTMVVAFFAFVFAAGKLTKDE